MTPSLRNAILEVLPGGMLLLRVPKDDRDHMPQVIHLPGGRALSQHTVFNERYAEHDQVGIIYGFGQPPNGEEVRDLLLYLASSAAPIAALKEEKR